MPTDFFSGKEHQPWTLAQIYADLGAAGDVARTLNVKLKRVTHWIKTREENNCPRPVRIFGPTRVYSLTEWRDWYDQWLQDRKWLVGTCDPYPDWKADIEEFFRA